MIRRPIRMAQLAILLVLATAILTSAGLVLAEKKKDLAGTKHDVASEGNQACVYCHLPRESEGELLWAREPNSEGTFSGLKPLCFSCHDGTVANIRKYAFRDDSPLHETVPGVKGQDCDRCHDPHETGYGKFIKYSGGADFCHNCHEEAGPGDHPIDVDVRVLGHLPLDSTWNPDVGDSQGTRLWNEDGTADGTYVKCLTCHAPHGGLPDTAMNTMGVSASHEEFMPLCQNCHYRWDGD